MALGGLAGVVAPAGLLAYLVVHGAPDPRIVLALLVVGGVVVLAFAGWLIGRRDEALADRNRQLRRLSQQLHALSVTDALTGLANRRAFDDRLGLEVTLANRYHRDLALVILDLDRFKDTNDLYGHRAGDEVLRTIGAILARERRAGDLVARYGGEEFAAILPHSDARAATAWSERVRAAIAAAATAWSERVRAAIAAAVIASAAGSVRITASFGVATFRDGDRHTPEALLEAADAALYAAKGSGRNRVMVVDLGHRQPAPMAS